MPRKKRSLGAGAVLLVLVLYLLAWPVPIDPARWVPPPAPELSGTYASNEVLGALERLEIGPAFGPEDVAIDEQGRIYGGVDDGRILRLSPDASSIETFATTGGRPLGLDFDAAGNLIVADAYEGLLSIDSSGAITVLSTGYDGTPYGFTDDVEVAADGTIYFSDASHRFAQGNYKLDILEHRPNGRLLAFDPVAGETRLVMDGLYFANGVAVAADGSFVLVNETTKYRVRKVWIDGPNSGQSEIFIDNLPGFPDGISSAPDGIFWLALVSPRDPVIDEVLLPRPFLRRIVVRLPEALSPKPHDYSFVLGLDATGRVVHNLQDPAASFAQITSVQQHGGTLYMGSLFEPAIGRLDLGEFMDSPRTRVAGDSVRRDGPAS